MYKEMILLATKFKQMAPGIGSWTVSNIVDDIIWLEPVRKRSQWWKRKQGNREGPGSLLNDNSLLKN
jgi:hypothetical protein